jgi:hypothetical protein
MEKTYRIKEAALFATPLPMETRTYKPVSHREIADVTLEAIHKAGFKLGKQQYSAAYDGEIANARYTITDVADSEMQLEIGWQNSYNKKLTLKFAIGSRIFICDNGCVSGDMGAFKRKHTGGVVDFSHERIIESIKRSADTFKEIQSQRDFMKTIEASTQVQAELIGRMYIQEEIIKGSQLAIIRDELKKPSFDYGCPNSLWELYNHTTFAMKEVHPSLWMDSHIKIHNFFNKYGILPPPGIEDEDMEEEVIIPKVDPSQTSLLDEIELAEQLYGVDNVQ